MKKKVLRNKDLASIENQASSIESQESRIEH